MFAVLMVTWLSLITIAVLICWIRGYRYEGC